MCIHADDERCQSYCASIRFAQTKLSWLFVSRFLFFVPFLHSSPFFSLSSGIFWLSDWLCQCFYSLKRKVQPSFFHWCENGQVCLVRSGYKPIEYIYSVYTFRIDSIVDRSLLFKILDFLQFESVGIRSDSFTYSPACSLHFNVSDENNFTHTQKKQRKIKNVL